MIFQCEPSAYADAKLKAAQRVGAAGDRPRQERSDGLVRRGLVRLRPVSRRRLARRSPLRRRHRRAHVRPAAGRPGDPLARGHDVGQPDGPARLCRETDQGAGISRCDRRGSGARGASSLDAQAKARLEPPGGGHHQGSRTEGQDLSRIDQGRQGQFLGRRLSGLPGRLRIRRRGLGCHGGLQRPAEPSTTRPRPSSWARPAGSSSKAGATRDSPRLKEIVEKYYASSSYRLARKWLAERK